MSCFHSIILGNSKLNKLAMFSGAITVAVSLGCIGGYFSFFATKHLRLSQEVLVSTFSFKIPNYELFWDHQVKDLLERKARDMGL